MTRNYEFTSESVSRGHPDKICDQISDSVLDAFLDADPDARLGCETMVTSDWVAVGGEYRGPQAVVDNIESIVRECIRNIGYEQDAFHWERVTVENHLVGQSADIAKGVDTGGAGDQGLMFGFAVDQTDELMPAPIHYAHRILESLDAARNADPSSPLGPDAKTQLTFRYVNDQPVAITRIVVSSQHQAGLSSDDVRQIIQPVVSPVIDRYLTDDTDWLINPTGEFVRGGPQADAGLTGRKIIVDTYGGSAPHGGGAFSGKDPTKVDRSAAYAARYLAKNIVAAGLAGSCLIQVSYAIGVAEPTSLTIDMRGTHRADPEAIRSRILDVMPMTPGSIRETLCLNNPIYLPTAAYGHFGRVPGPGHAFSWEACNLIDSLRDLA
ncbi:MAG: methionine adenosyltransferase [Rhodobacteraceae bacterium]|nr:methionine adenosyltransferase [Paracoccaceae bacterium]